MNKGALVLLLIFKNKSYDSWFITWMKNVNNYQMLKGHRLAFS